MNKKHLRKGDPLPSMGKGKIRLYSMRFCPYAQRVQLVLDAKKIPYDVVNINLSDKPEWLLEKSPLGKVPAIELEDENSTLYESLILSDFLDEAYPNRPLHSKDPCKKAKDKLAIAFFDQVIAAVYKVHYRSSSCTLNTEHLEELFSCLEYYEKELIKRGTLFFGGARPGMLDYMIWPWCERSDVFKIVGGEKFVIPKARFGRLLEWRTAMLQDEAVRASCLDPNLHARYFQSHKAGFPDYDLLIR